MPLPAAPGSPTVPGNLPVVGQGGPPGSPPGGPQGLTMPTPNRGLQAAALAQVQWAVRLLEKALPLLGAETDQGKDVMKALTTLSKHIPAGSGSPGVEQSALRNLMMEQKQNQPLLQLLRNQGGGAGAGAAPGGAPPTPTPAAA